MKTCINCGTEIKTKGYCTECRKVVRKGYYETWKAKHMKKAGKFCGMENCITIFYDTRKKYCINHR